MFHIKIARLFTVILFVTAGLPVYSQTETSSPSKFDMKKDGDGDGVKTMKQSYNYF